MSDMLNKEALDHESQSAEEAGVRLSSMIGEGDNVGDLLSLNYDEAVVLVHDFLRKRVGGLPMGCFLLATRLKPGEKADISEEDTSLLLLRVLADARLPNNADTAKYRMDASFRSIDSDENWDSDQNTDQFTLNQLRHAGVNCSVLGTFRMRENDGAWKLSFGADISNFYSGQGMKVYKPIGNSLGKIVNYAKPTGSPHPLAGHKVPIGRVRYCSSEILEGLGKENVGVEMEPTDLLARRAALFGMSRSGKSNTVKIIAESIFNIRRREKGVKVGQLIFDVNGEYCNDNPQDEGCLRNISNDEVVTYGLLAHPNDPDRKLLKINFLGDDTGFSWDDREQVLAAMDTLIKGKDIINDMLSDESSGYVVKFRNTSMEPPDTEWGKGDIVRYKRAVQIYRALLISEGFKSARKHAFIDGLFSKDFREAMMKEYPDSANILGDKQVEWSVFRKAVGDIKAFMSSDGSGFKKFSDEYAARNKKQWSDTCLNGVLSLLENTRGPRLVGKAQFQHDPSAAKDYADAIAQEVREGRLVIVDQSTGHPDLVKGTTERIAQKLFNMQKDDFTTPKRDDSGNILPPPDTMIYVEEAHNLLPATAKDLHSIWSRMAKEGSKFRIGMVYSTQEPSSILSNILKNTDNWFVAHLNNQDEIKELKKYYDFEAFGKQILKVPDTGFIRMRCLSNPYIVPIQVKKFVTMKEKDAE